VLLNHFYIFSFVRKEKRGERKYKDENEKHFIDIECITDGILIVLE